MTKSAVTVLTIRIGGTPSARKKVQEQIENTIEALISGNIELPTSGFGGMGTTVHEERSVS
jgi:hypothetical protein